MFFLIALLQLAFAGELRVEMLNVGQGDAILIRSPGGKNVLIDAGTGKKHDIVSDLKSRGVKSLNLVVATHAHADHIGGMDEVLESIPVKAYMDNGMPYTTRTYKKVMQIVANQGIKYLKPKLGRKLKLDDGASLEILHPQLKLLSGTRSDPNSNSIVLRLTHGKNCFLFTGDAEEPTERVLLQKGITPCNVLKVAHHGSNHSSSSAFLDAVQPDIALISAGVNNRYNHPGKETMQRLKRMKAKIYRTDTMGSVELISTGSKLKISAGGKHHQIKANTKATQHPKPTAHTTAPQASSGSFDINTASESQLKSIPGIGPSKAKAIISYRDTHGPFQHIHDVQRVSGIGAKLSERIATYAYVKE